MTSVLSPAAGVVHALADVPDPVFAAEMVGPGLAVDPTREAQQAIAPVAGEIVKLLPHAFAIMGEGVNVLVHLGIDTVQLGADGFELLAAQGDQVTAGQPLVRWDPAAVEASGRSPYVMVCALDEEAGAVAADSAGSTVAIGDELFAWG